MGPEEVIRDFLLPELRALKEQQAAFRLQVESLGRQLEEARSARLLEEREELRGRLRELERRVEGLRGPGGEEPAEAAGLERRLQELEQRLESLQRELAARLEEANGRFKAIAARFETLDGQLEARGSRLEQAGRRLMRGQWLIGLALLALAALLALLRPAG